MNQITDAKDVRPDQKKMSYIHDDCAIPPLNVSSTLTFLRKTGKVCMRSLSNLHWACRIYTEPVEFTLSLSKWYYGKRFSQNKNKFISLCIRLGSLFWNEEFFVPNEATLQPWRNNLGEKRKYDAVIKETNPMGYDHVASYTFLKNIPHPAYQ